MSEAVLVAIITGVCAVVGQWMIVRNQSAKDAYERGQRDKKLDDDIKSLSDRVDEHNNYAKLFYDTSAKIDLMAQDIQYLKEGVFSHAETKQV